jgi:hypothetical protein
MKRKKEMQITSSSLSIKGDRSLIVGLVVPMGISRYVNGITVVVNPSKLVMSLSLTHLN